MINREKINGLRTYINKNQNDLIEMYKNKDGKNLWSGICSSADWLEVAVEYLESINQDLFKENSNRMSMDLVTLIMAIDIVVESINNLNKIIYGTNYVLENDYGVFNHKIKGTKGDDINDNVAFKRLRAMFATHQMDIKEKDKKDGKEIEIAKYTSWSGSLNNKIFVVIYDSRANEKDEEVSFTYKQLVEFTKKRYNYIDKLIDKLDKNRLEYFKSKKS